MINKILALAFVALGMSPFAVAQNALPEGDIDSGEELTETCADCHGAAGDSSNAQYPKLSGQNVRYLVEQMQAFREGARVAPMMAGQLDDMSDQDLADIAAFYNAQETSFGAADADLVELGESIYRAGIEESGVVACIACHGPNGNGNAPAGFPQIGGQHADYILSQLNKYATGYRADEPSENARMTDGDTMMMRSVAFGLKDFEREAVASYIQGLNPAPDN